MSGAEVIILIVGAILFTVSFFIPDRNDKSEAVSSIDSEAVKAEVKTALEDELRGAKYSLEEALEETMEESRDKMERYMERLTNEKIMAVNEYSDTVLEQIHKDHQEAVFLYDMVESKYAQVKSTAAEINQIEKSVKNLAERTSAVSMEKTVDDAGDKVSKASDNKEVAFSKAKKQKAEPTVAGGNTRKEADKPVEKQADNFKPLENVERIEVPAFAQAATPTEVELMFDSEAGGVNNNDRILALHKEGKSNMAIAKELGLGVGEVKLVIDLFKSY